MLAGTSSLSCLVCRFGIGEMREFLEEELTGAKKLVLLWNSCTVL